MDHFLKHNLPQLSLYEIDNMNRHIMIKEIESIILKLPQKKSPGSDGSTGECYQTEELTVIVYILFQKIEKERSLPNIFYEVSINIFHEYGHKNLNKILSSIIQQYIKRIMHCGQVGYKSASILENQSM